MAADKHETTLSLEGIDPLPLFGQADSNLRALEQRFGVELSSRGGILRIVGSREGVAGAEQVARALIERVRSGVAITSEDLEYFFSSANGNGSDLSAPVAGGVVLLGDKKAIKIRSKTQAEYVDAALSHDIVFGIGPAGTGKTYLAVALAVRLLKEKAVDRIILSRPAVEAGERLGYLPGDLQEKVDPYLRPLYDALHDMISLEKLQRFMQLGVIEIVPLAYMRGRTLSRAFIILDEAQNATLTQMKMFLTRLGIGSKAVITGDVTQVDLDDPSKSGLIQIQPILSKVPSIRFVHFTERDVVRHHLVREIILAFDRNQK
jgi:phosphate starvation-inducible PhoH-like protein